MSEKMQNIPKLRFPEFRDAPEWEEKKLGQICEVKNNKRKPISSTNRERGIYPYYGASGIVDYVKDYIFDERLLLIGEDGAKWGAFENSAFIVEGKYWVNNHAHVLKPTEVNNVLLQNYLNMLDLTPFITGAAPPKLTLGKLKDIPVPVPKSFDEQQKIGSCLSSIDELITSQAAKVEALKEHKKALMQQLFPREGETVPRLRFPEFQNAPEWEEKPLEKVANVTIGEFVIKTKQNPNSPYPVYNGGKSYTGFYDEFNNEGNKVIISARGANAGYVNLEKRRYWAGNSCYSVDVLNKNIHNLDFFYYYIKKNENRFLNNQQAANIPSVSKSDVLQFKISYPEFDEQQKIADCLSSIDELITSQSAKVEALKEHKKALMQQLFPTDKER